MQRAMPNALSMVDGSKYSEEYDGIPTRDIDDPGEQRAAVKLSQWRIFGMSQGM
jgi:hypothetical protein